MKEMTTAVNISTRESPLTIRAIAWTRQGEEVSVIEPDDIVEHLHSYTFQTNPDPLNVTIPTEVPLRVQEVSVR